MIVHVDVWIKLIKRFVIVNLGCSILVAMKRHYFSLIFIAVLVLSSCGIKTASEVGLQFSTKQSPLPDTLIWKNIGFAKELINQKELIVVISGGSNPIPLDQWNHFKAAFPYQKNIDRYLLFEQTAFYRSPNTAVNCKEADCIKERTYKHYTWVEMAQPICVDFIGGKTDMLKPAKGHLVVKTIQKCQAVRFTDYIFQLTDHKGNYYAMHATENGNPDTSVVLPSGWELKKVALQEPLIISPFGGGNICYFNIVGDHLGQGYHQYIFADSVYSGNKKTFSY